MNLSHQRRPYCHYAHRPSMAHMNHCKGGSGDNHSTFTMRECEAIACPMGLSAQDHEEHGCHDGNRLHPRGVTAHQESLRAVASPAVTLIKLS